MAQNETFDSVFWPIVLILLIGMCGVLGWVSQREEPANGHGVTHPKFVSMQQGGDGTRHLGQPVAH